MAALHAKAGRTRTLVLFLGVVVIAFALLAPGRVNAAQPSGQAHGKPATEPLRGEDESTLPSGRTHYRTLADYQRAMLRLANQYPNLVKVFALPYPTVQGRLVLGLEITRNVHEKNGKPSLAVVGMHHGDEEPSGEYTIEYAIDLAENYGENPRVTRLLQKTRVVLVPIVNVDGFVHNKRRNAHGVDINRNYGFGWAPGETHGSAPFSEPEPRNVKWLLSHHQATTFLTMHTCIQEVIWPPLQHEAGLTPDNERFAALGRDLADALETPGEEVLAQTSADDYETTGEVIAWSYYATRGLSFTVETCTEEGESKNFETLVVEEYPSVRAMFMKALENTANPAAHAIIEGKAPKGAVLTLSKSFKMWTNPCPDAPDGSMQCNSKRLPIGFQNHLETQLVVDKPNGKFEWHVNPSLRPVPPYQSDGLHTHTSGFLPEEWTLTCARPDGTVLQTTSVKVGLADTAHVKLKECKKEFHK